MADEIEPGPPAASTIVVGCGNLIRGDDAAGPVLVRLLAERGVPDGVRLVDGGTAGMDVAFALRGARRAIVVDASHLGVPPGTVHRVPGEELVDLRPPEGNLHRFRWDQALGFAQWLLGPDYPQDVTVWLVEGASFEPGAPLSPPVQAAVERVAGELLAELGAFPPGDPGADTPAARAAALASPAAPPAAMAAPAAIWERIDTRASHRSQVVAGGPGGTGGAAEPGGGTGGPGGTGGAAEPGGGTGGPGGTGSPSGGAVTDR